MPNKIDRPILPGCSVLPPMQSEHERPRASGKAKHTVKAEAATRPTGDRFAVLNGFVDFTLADLPRSDIAVWMVLYRDTKDGIARTSQTDIARRAGIGRRTVVRAIGHLKKQGLLEIVRRGGLNQGTSSYKVRPLEKDRGRVPKL